MKFPIAGKRSPIKFPGSLPSMSRNTMRCLFMTSLRLTPAELSCRVILMSRPDWDSASQISFGSKSVKQGEPERKKGTPWTEEEHRLFLIGLSKFGKGDWRSISRNVVVSRTPTQVASHAQKYFLRQTSVKKERKRASIHDITTVDTKPLTPPVDQNWNPSPGVPGHQQPPTYQQFPPPNQFPSQGGAMGYQNYGFPM
ncbi:hypothetical protein Patl1_05860 [Pistacia atlantica]|uniref:Uncharacterized protein n=1 Tax=Pistacia atlantica TaxID=434234 RepID=A0ACC1BS90_9ROSI|nr:hypothetical protein Patl1_05860 [Pistacia atlantica]